MLLDLYIDVIVFAKVAQDKDRISKQLIFGCLGCYLCCDIHQSNQIVKLSLTHKLKLLTYVLHTRRPLFEGLLNGVKLDLSLLPVLHSVPQESSQS